MYDLLSGVRIVDLSTMVLGPYATQMLGDMGAEVIKVEPMGGDLFRFARPGRPGGDGGCFLNTNRNKRSIQLNLDLPEDHDILTRLTRKSDAFVHNMRPGSAEKLGIGYAQVSAHNPQIVYCSARGFAEGPQGDEPAYDDCIQSASGLAWLNAGESGAPRFVPSVVCDKVAGLHLAFAIATGLAARSRTGRGTCIETPMFEAMASFTLIEHLAAAAFDPPLGPPGYDRLASPNRRPHATRDGYVVILPYTTAHWLQYLALIGRHDLLDADFVIEPELRSLSIDRLYGVIAEASGRHTTAEWLAMLREAGIPCAPVNSLEDLLQDQQLRASGLFETLEHPTEGALRLTGSPFNVRTAQRTPTRPPPNLDGDRDYILSIIADPA